MIMKTLHTQRGFTIIETLVALSIFTTSILAIIVMTPGGIAAINGAKNKLTASYLAQEGIDLMRAYRDGGNFGGNGDALDSLVTSACIGSCTIDFNLQPTACIESDTDNDGIPECPILVHDQTLTGDGGFVYTLPPTGNDLFERVISITPVPSTTDEFMVISKVKWNQGGQPHTVQYQTNLTDWNNP